MRRIMGLTAAAAIVGMASAVSADELTGTIKEIDETTGNIVVTDAAAPDREQIFAVSDVSTAGATLDDLKEGDKVTVFFAESGSGGPVNAMQIDKVEE